MEEPIWFPKSASMRCSSFEWYSLVSGFIFYDLIGRILDLDDYFSHEE